MKLRAPFLALVPAMALLALAPGAEARTKPKIPEQASDSYYASAKAAVEARGRVVRDRAKAKNVILFIGDGMGVSTVTAGRIYAGQKKGQDGVSYRLAMDELPYTALSRTYTHDSQVADSAPTATAMTTGVKTLNGTIGVRQSVTPGKCSTEFGSGTESLWEMAERAGLATGVISTARLTHATPAATYAQTVERDWEKDADLTAEARADGCRDIADQFLGWNQTYGDGFEVALAGGREAFLPSDAADPEYPEKKGKRADGRNLVNEWKALSPKHVFVSDAAGFNAVDWKSDVRVLGLFEPSHMQYELDRDAAREPSLADMTRAAISRLSRNKNGYVLMVEAGRIDHAHHAGNAARALADVAALDEAVRAAVAATDEDDTLIVVTADHSHVFTIAGYPDRNNPILGPARVGDQDLKGADGKPYTTLGYANGPGAVCRKTDDGERCERPDVTGIDTAHPDYKQQALVPLDSETHGGEDVAIYARGPGAAVVRGTMEQNEIFHVMARALGLPH